VLVCGGLGPTHDDITREAITEVMGSELVVDDAVAERDPGTCSSRGAADADNNLRRPRFRSAPR
jgi:nicotinamide-nucleotide amidase